MRFAVVVAALALSSAVVAQPCPVEAPPPHAVAIQAPGCTSVSCPHGTPIVLNLVPLETSGFPPAVPYGGYRIQSCDEVTWDFGDGTPHVVTTGQTTITHTFAEPGNYLWRVTVRNSLGSAVYTSPRVVASTLASIATVVTRVKESAPSAQLTFVRSGELGRRVSATFMTSVDPYGIDPVLPAGKTTVVFEAGETMKSVPLPLSDNKVYDGLRLAPMGWSGGTGGVVFPQHLPILWIEDDEKQPTIVAEDVIVQEGDAGRTRVTMPVHLTGPLGTYLNLSGSLWDGTADSNDYRWQLSGTQIRAGELSGVVTFDVVGDTNLEADETLTFRIGPYGGIPSSPINGAPATITIVNDDAGITPRRATGLVGETLVFMLYPGGQRFSLPRAFPVRISDPSCASTPQSVRIEPGQPAVPIVVALQGEGFATISANVGGRVLTADVDSALPRSILATPRELRLAEGASANVTLSFAPPRDTPLTVLLTGNTRILEMPAYVTIPAGGSVTFAVRALKTGGTAIGVSATPAGIAGTAVFVDVTPPVKRRRSVR